MPAPPNLQRSLPSVERLVESAGATRLPRPLVVDQARLHLARCRTRLAGVDTATADPADFTPDAILRAFDLTLARLERSRLGPVINATGILIHTNLGRSPLSATAVEAVAGVARGYANLEFDVESGERGPRAEYLRLALATLFEADEAIVVNNCAAALVLILRHLTRNSRKEVVISRGELVQIGGGFRIPDILAATGARLREVGTTNQTSLADYRDALGPETALVLAVHRSNFYMDGFVSSPEPAALAALAREAGVPFVVDLGSGAAVDLAESGVSNREPLPGDVLGSGSDLVCFSADKLFGGPQAGIIVGRGDMVLALAKDPFFRALRCDKLVFAALQATVESYLHAAARKDLGPPDDIPILAALRTPVSELRRRAESIAAQLAGLPFDVTVVEVTSPIGGGVCPRSNIPSIALRLLPRNQSVDDLASHLRRRELPIIGCIADKGLHLDLRTVRPDEDDAILRALKSG